MLYGLTIFVGAFLLFQVQLILGKAILPWFGGTPAVWTTCLAFFQILLLAGYTYAHASIAWLKPRAQSVVHVGLIGIACLELTAGAIAWGTPLLPGAHWKPPDALMPIPRILAILTVCVGLPYLVLSSTSPLLQAWFARRWPERSPYRLYALSNAGSLLGLLSYPMLLEPSSGLHTQGKLWAALFAVYALGSALCARDALETAGVAQVQARPPLARCLYWLLLAACASMLLLSTSNHLCEEVSVSPILWVLPLTVYLVTFILTFERDGFYRRSLFAALFSLGLLGSLWVLQEAAVQRLLYVVGIDLFTLFCGCMICHGELVRSKPAPVHLTMFYLTVSLGGALGGTVVSLLAPHVFKGFLELQLSLVLCLVLLLTALVRDRGSWLYQGNVGVAALLAGLSVVVVWIGRPTDLLLGANSTAVSTYLVLSFCAMLLGSVMMLAVSAALRLGLSRRQPRLTAMAAVMVVAAFGCALANTATVFRWAQVEYAGRNFYGVQRVVRTEQMRMLAHGGTLHGWQRLDRPQMPLGYYAHGSGVGLAFDLLREVKRPLRVALVGLGTGTIAAYGEPGDDMRYFEIDPQVIEISTGGNAWFTYAADSKAHVTVVQGDARLSLERERGPFDLIVLDAFSSDVIPVHLMTRQAFELYSRLLDARGVLAVHISNRYVDLGPVVRRLCDEENLHAAFVVRAGEDGMGVESWWVLASRDATLLERPLAKRMITPEFDEGPARDLWTDDWSNVLQALRK